MGTISLANATDEERRRLTKFSVRLQTAIMMRGYRSPRDFADQAGVSETAIMRYVRGYRVPSAPLVIRLADTLDVSCDWLLGYEPAETARRTIALKVAQDARRGAREGGGGSR